MTISIEIPKEFEEHFNNDRFHDSLERIRVGKIVNIVGVKNPITNINPGRYEMLYNEIAQDYAERHNAPYVHIFRDGKLVATIARRRSKL